MSSVGRAPSGRWRVRFVDADGKRQSRTFSTLREAKMFAAFSEQIAKGET